MACGGPQSLAGAGAVCFRPDDCQAGLECVPVAKGAKKRVCSADLSAIVAMVDGAPPEAATATGDAGPGAGGASATDKGGAPSAAGTGIGAAAGG